MNDRIKIGMECYATFSTEEIMDEAKKSGYICLPILHGYVQVPDIDVAEGKVPIQSQVLFDNGQTVNCYNHAIVPADKCVFVVNDNDMETPVLVTMDYEKAKKELKERVQNFKAHFEDIANILVDKENMYVARYDGDDGDTPNYCEIFISYHELA